ncbi:unnamed protein product [Dibothriocephalus latus]|uniref:Uncharacterized protein n=1 Tax=Dibothriocephalus latus TaxID=60516 RepID=A0A3P6TRX1_DIBLA|nr:unnamed protein product [Dibothriocephalus latus]
MRHMHTFAHLFKWRKLTGRRVQQKHHLSAEEVVVAVVEVIRKARVDLGREYGKSKYSSKTVVVEAEAFCAKGDISAARLYHVESKMDSAFAEHFGKCPGYFGGDLTL